MYQQTRKIGFPVDLLKIDSFVADFTLKNCNFGPIEEGNKKFRKIGGKCGVYI